MRLLVSRHDNYIKMMKIRYRRLRVIGKWLLALGLMTAVTYPIIIYPMIDPDPYKEMQKMGRKDLVQEDIQPGNMRVWSDPFGRRNNKMVEDGKQGMFFKGF